LIPKLKKGQRYKTRGGWTAICIWVNANDLKEGGFCIHEPCSKVESCPLRHWGDGSAHATFSINEAPYYDGHPADLMEELK